MVFDLDESIFVDRNHAGLMLLLYSAIDNAAYLKFDLDSKRINSWIAANNSDDWQIAHSNYICDCATYKLVNEVKVTSKITTSNWVVKVPEITLDDAKKLIAMPFQIWLENGINDGRFLRLALSRSNSLLLKKLENEQRVEPKTLGGISEMKKNLNKKATSLGYRNKRFVFCDSDAPRKGSLQPEARKIVDTCVANSIPHHCLERRSIENYLPVDYLISKIHPNVRAKSSDCIKYNAFKKLTEEQQHHYHMKVGIMDFPLSQSGLYDSVMDTILCEGDLWEGFSSKYADKFLQNENEWGKIRKIMREQDSSRELSDFESKLLEHIRLPV